jgi:hypothetical protein
MKVEHAGDTVTVVDIEALDYQANIGYDYWQREP